VIGSLLPPVAAAALAAAAAAPGASLSPGRPLVSLSATPARLTLLGGIPATLVVHNDGAARVRVVAQTSSFVFDQYGNADVAPRREPPRSGRRWLSIRPRQLVLAPGQEGLVRVVARAPHGASPGDHHALVLLSSVLPGRSRVSVRTRLGVLTFVRVPGRVLRHVAIARVRVVRGRGRRVLVTLVNRGNVTERLARGQVTITLRRPGRAATVLRTLPRDLLAGTTGLVAASVPRSLRGAVAVVVRIAGQPGWTAGPASPALRPSSRTVRLRL
jgi:hypothetical protein